MQCSTPVAMAPCGTFRKHVEQNAADSIAMWAGSPDEVIFTYSRVWVQTAKALYETGKG
ncbi:MAG: hypothetical protein HGA41_10740 [Syntrophaceae bacterium]|nr:hypothetical protein [Syntrophaceae bacterium]